MGIGEEKSNALHMLSIYCIVKSFQSKSASESFSLRRTQKHCCYSSQLMIDLLDYNWDHFILSRFFSKIWIAGIPASQSERLFWGSKGSQILRTHTHRQRVGRGGRVMFLTWTSADLTALCAHAGHCFVVIDADEPPPPSSLEIIITCAKSF